jgi:hypothetical protein
MVSGQSRIEQRAQRRPGIDSPRPDSKKSDLADWHGFALATFWANDNVSLTTHGIFSNFMVLQLACTFGVENFRKSFII